MNIRTHKQQQLNALYAPYTKAATLLVEGGSKKIIFGEGNSDAKLMIIGEAPGAQEDLQGRPFVGRSGKLLNKIFESIGLKREDLFITNIVKVRPPGNRKPTPAEIEQGRELLFEQMDIIKPKVICTLGASSLEALIGKQAPITKLRGQSFNFRNTLVMPAYHPAYILRKPKELKMLTQDILQAYELTKTISK